jgi:hypothetical protein
MLGSFGLGATFKFNQPRAAAWGGSNPSTVRPANPFDARPSNPFGAMVAKQKADKAAKDALKAARKAANQAKHDAKKGRAMPGQPVQAPDLGPSQVDVPDDVSMPAGTTPSANEYTPAPEFIPSSEPSEAPAAIDATTGEPAPAPAGGGMTKWVIGAAAVAALMMGRK